MSITLTTDELQLLTGYKRAAQQLQELHRQGFWRARLAPTTGRVLLERSHYEAVCSGQASPTPAHTPKLREPRLRAA